MMIEEKTTMSAQQEANMIEETSRKMANGTLTSYDEHQVLDVDPARSSDDELAVLSLRNLLFDICNQYGGGHGGSAIGMAAIGVALYKYVMRYSPSNPGWFDRDRFVLSNGMCSHWE